MLGWEHFVEHSYITLNLFPGQKDMETNIRLNWNVKPFSLSRGVSRVRASYEKSSRDRAYVPINIIVIPVSYYFENICSVRLIFKLNCACYMVIKRSFSLFKRTESYLPLLLDTEAKSTFSVNFFNFLSQWIQEYYWVHK